MPFQSKYDTTDVTKSTADKIKELTPTKNYALPNHIMYAALIRKIDSLPHGSESSCS